MRRVLNKIISAEIGFIHKESIYTIKQKKGILLEVVSKKPLSKKKLTEQLWISLEVAFKLKLLPKDYELLTDHQINRYLNEHSINKVLTLKSSIRKRRHF